MSKTSPVRKLSTGAQPAAQLPARLTLEWLLAELVAAGLIPPEATRQLKLPPAAKGAAIPHPLVIAASQDWSDGRSPQARLTVEALTQWLANRVQMPYERIDPLSLNVGKLTEVVPYAYASRVGILPIKALLADLDLAAFRPVLTAIRRNASGAASLQIGRAHV